MSLRQGRIYPALVCASTILALMPPLAVVCVLATTGADNLSNDYVAYIGIIDRILSGTYSWADFPHDTFYRTHSVALPVILHALAAWLLRFNIYAELYFGVALACARVVLIHTALSHHLPQPLRLALWPVLSALVFSLSQMSVYCFGDASLTIGLSLTGFALGVWGLSCGRLWAVVAGGLIASYSWANGLVSWFVFLAGLALSGNRRRSHYVLWLAGLAVSLLPYLLFLVLPRLSSTAPAYAGTTPVSLLNWRFIVNTLGWPFANGIASQTSSAPFAATAGWSGMALLGSGIALMIMARDRIAWQRSVPAWLFVMHGLLSVWQISVFRNLIAPWYTAPAMSFWIGLAALSFQAAASSGGRPAKALRLWSGICAVFIVSAFFRGNLTYEDKTDMLFSRSPASDTALRSWDTAPTYADRLLFQWGSGSPDLLAHLGQPLERHNLSSFSPAHRWTLQGDYLLDSVSVTGPLCPVSWIEGFDAKRRLPWFHYKHLNLLLPAPSAVTWLVDIPADARKATLVTRVRAEASMSPPPSLRALVTVESPGGSATAKATAVKREWQPLSLPLPASGGGRLKITFRCLGHRQGERVVFEHPSLAIERAGAPGNPEARPQRPGNTDLAAGGPACTHADSVLFPAVTAAAGGAGRTLAGHADRIEISGLSAKLSDFSHLIFSARARGSERAKAAVVTFSCGSQTVKAEIPLLNDEARHRYSYKLDLLDLEAGARIEGLALSPAGTGDTVEVDMIGLIRRQPPAASEAPKLPGRK